MDETEVICAFNEPSNILLVFTKFVPVIVTTVPPESGPHETFREVIVGTVSFVYVKPLNKVAIPPGEVTLISFEPDDPDAGVVAYIFLSSLSSKIIVAEILLICTDDTFVKCCP